MLLLECVQKTNSLIIKMEGKLEAKLDRQKINEIIESEAFKRSMVKVLKSLASLVRAQQVRAVLVRSKELDKYVVLSTSNKPPTLGERHLIKWVCQTGIASNIHVHSPITDENGNEIAIAQEPSVTVPLLLDNDCYGVLQLQGKLGGENFNDHDGHLVESSTSLFTRFILEIDWQHHQEEGYHEIIFSMHRLLFENLYLYKQNLESNQLYGEIIRVSKLVNTTLDLQSLLEAIMSSAKLVLRTESSSLMLLDKETGELFFTIITGGSSKSENKLLKEIRIPKGQGIAGYVAENRKALIVNDPANDPRWFKGADEKTNFVTRNILAVPLVVRNQVIGVLEVINALDRDNFNEKDLELFNSFSELSALAIYNRNLMDSLTRTNKELARKVDDLSSLHEVSKAMISTLDENQLFEQVVDIISQVSSVKRVFIALEDFDAKALKLVSHCGIGERGKNISLSLESSLIGKCFQENRTINTNNLQEEEYSSYSDTQDILKNNCILYPLAHKDGVYGVVGISESKGESDFGDDDIQLLSTIGGQIIKAIQNFRMVEGMLQKREYDKELEITSSIQKEILPSSKLNSKHMDVAVLSIPARLMGGDFYDYHAFSDSEFTFTIADVSGKSLPASLFMAVTSSILRTVSREHPYPADVLRRSNDLIFQDSDSGMFVTVFYCLYDAQKKLMRFASAGHNELFLYRKRTQEVEFYKTRGAPLGILSSEEYGQFQESQFTVENEDVILLFTDGVTEAINEKKEEFGEERLVELFKEIHDLSAEEMIHAVYQKVQEFSGEEPQFDDVTLMVVKAINEEKKSLMDVYEKEFRLDVKELIHVKNFLEETLSKWRVSQTIVSDVILSCDEAVTNIISYAYKGREQEKETDTFSIVLAMKEKEFVVTIKDKGNPFNYDKVPQPSIVENLEGKRKGGFGVFLIRALMDSNDFYREGEYNFLKMTKKIN